MNTDMRGHAGHHRPAGQAGREQRLSKPGSTDLNEAAAQYPGFLAAEVTPPTAVQPGLGGGVPLRFDRQRAGLINSATRQERLAPAQTYFDGPATQQVIGGGASLDRSAGDGGREPPRRARRTSRTSLAWQERLRAGGARSRASAWTELFRPVDGAGRVDGAVPVRERR